MGAGCAAALVDRDVVVLDSDAIPFSLSEYLRAELVRVADRPTPDELWARLRARSSVEAQESSAEAVRALRERDG